MRTLEVFAEVRCPFTHVGLRLLRAERTSRGLAEPVLRVRAWPLDMEGPALVPKVEVLRASVAPDLFAGFDPDRFPTSSREAMASEVAAYRVGADAGERFSLAVRDALFERGLDVSDPDVLAAVRAEVGDVPEPTDDDRAAVDADRAEGERRGVVGSPHYFTDRGDFFCPSLDIEHPDGRLEVSFDEEGFRRFTAAAFSPT